MKQILLSRFITERINLQKYKMVCALVNKANKWQNWESESRVQVQESRFGTGWGSGSNGRASA
jgi:hypothetical protein